ncbi:MAG: lytic transglycosylase domain-containing protein [Bacteroidales bacterium]|nr:lytic transglycosylase domain-containing protein [Bacteroidales bacterium]
MKVPFLLVAGVGLGLIVANLFISSDTISTAESEKINAAENVLPYKVFQPYIPDTLTFCGETVPLENFDVYEALDFELIANTYRHSSTLLYIKRANRYFPEIEKTLQKQGIPDDFKYLCVAESGLANVVSPAGAAGFWQFMKATAGEYNLKVDKEVDERYNHKKSLLAAIQYLHKAHTYFGNWTLAAASYNMGMGGLKKDIDFHRVKTYCDLDLNQETARYVYRILALKLIMSNPELYGFDIAEEDLYHEIKTVEITVDSTINDLVQFAFDNGTNYKMLKYFNPWITGKSLLNTARKEYTIVLPADGERKCDIPK